jgi:hypothetical protein
MLDASEEMVEGGKQSSLRRYGTGSRLRKGLVRAAVQPTHLILAAASTTAALVVGAWWLFFLGLLVCTTYIAVTISRPQFWRLVAPEPSTQMQRLDDIKVHDPALQALVSAFGSGRRAIEQALSETTEDARRSLGVESSLLDELEGQVARLVVRAQELSVYLQALKQSKLMDEVQQLSDLVRRGVDVQTRKDCDEVLAWQHEQVQRIEQASMARERAVAGLLQAVVIVKELPARILGMRILQAELQDATSADLSDIWNQIRQELQSSEDSLNGMRALPAKE